MDAHPESFQLEKSCPRIYVNLPKSRKIAVVDRETHSITKTWGTGLSFANYAMALDEADHRLFVVTRLPARLLVLDTEGGKIVQKLSAVGDCDDVFFDQTRNASTRQVEKVPFRFLSNRTPITTKRLYEFRQ